jgi:hypothetical protein
MVVVLWVVIVVVVVMVLGCLTLIRTCLATCCYMEAMVVWTTDFTLLATSCHMSNSSN